MFISFTKYVASVPGLVYTGFEGILEVHLKGNVNPNGTTIINPAYYDPTIYSDFANSMLEFKDKPNGIVSYIAKSNLIDTTYSVTMFNTIEDFIGIAQTSWFEDYIAKRAAYLNLLGIQVFQKNIEVFPIQLTTETTFEELASSWEVAEVTIA